MNFFFWFKRHSFPARATPFDPCHISSLNPTIKIIRTDSGVSLLNGCRLPISRILGEKAGPSPAGKKIHFSSEIARCSTRARLPAAGDASLTSSNSSPEIRSQTEKLLDRYENGRVGRAKADAPASLEPSGSYFSPGMFPTTCPFPGGHPPLPRKWQVSFH